MKLYFAPNSRAVRIAWLLEELGITYEIEKYTVGDKALRTPEYFKLHPMGRVPVLEDKDVKIYESGAILEYLLAKYDTGNFHPNKDDPTFPYYLQWFHYCEGMVMPPMNQVVVQTILLPPDRRDENVLKQAQNLITKSLGPVNDNLADKDYLVGNFSAADLMLGHSCFMANRLGCVPDEMEHIKNYVARIEARPAFQKAITLGE